MKILFYFLLNSFFVFIQTGCAYRPVGSTATVGSAAAVSTKSMKDKVPAKALEYQIIQIGDVDSPQKVHATNWTLFQTITSQKHDCRGGVNGSENTCKTSFLVCNVLDGSMPYAICRFRVDREGSLIEPSFDDDSKGSFANLPLNEVKKNPQKFVFRFQGVMAQNLFNFMSGSDKIKKGRHVFCESNILEKNQLKKYTCQFALDASGKPQ